MKKIFSFVAASAMLLTAHNALADTVIYSWEGGSEAATESGGTVVANGTNTAVSASRITVSAKKADIAENNVTITLNEALAAGDVISITGYRDKDETTDGNGTVLETPAEKVGNLYIAFGTGTAIDEGSNNVWNNINANAIGGAKEANTNTYTITDQAGSTTIQLARSKASTNVFITKIAITRPEEGGGEPVVRELSGLALLIKNAVEGAAEGAKSVTIELTEDVVLDSIYDPVAMSLVINGNGHVVTVKGDGQLITQQGLEVNNTNFNCAEGSKAPIALSANPDSVRFSASSYAFYETQRTKAFYDTCAIVLKGCNFSDLKTSLFSCNNMPWTLTTLTVDSCVAQFNFASGDPYFNFQNSVSEGALKNFTIKNSTLYNIVESNDAYFIRFANASNGQPSKAFPSDNVATINFLNNTFVNTCSNKNFGNNTQNNNAFVADLRGNVFYNVFRLNKYIQSQNVCTSFTNADNAICGVTNAVDGSDLTRFATEDTLLCKTETAFTVPTVAFDFNVEALAANFTPAGRSYAHRKGYGDPRWVTEYDEPAVADGIYYLCDKATGLYYSRGQWWGTAVVTDYFGYPVEIAANSEKLCTIKCHDWNNTGFGKDLYADQEPVTLKLDGDGKEGFVIIKDGQYVKANGANVQISLTANIEEATVWTAISLDEYEAAVAAQLEADKAAALSTAGITADSLANYYIAKDSSILIQNAALSGSYEGWTWTGVRENSNLATNANGTECFQGTGTLSQTAKVAPGLYRVSFQAMYRSGANAAVAGFTNEGYNLSTMYLNANGNKVRAKSWGIDRASDSNPNSMGEFKALADQGKYYVETYAFVDADSVLSLSININSFSNGGWAIFCNVKLESFSSEVSAEDAAALLATVPTGKMNADVEDALTNAKGAFEGLASVVNYNALLAAIANAEQSIKDYAAVAAAVEAYATKVASLDADGQAAYDISAVTDAYEDGSMDADLSADIVAAFFTAVKSQTSVGSDWTALCGTTVSDWIGASATYSTCVERYNGDTPYAEGQILYQTVSGLKPSYPYTVKFTAIANVARNLDVATYAGEGIAYVFANDSVRNITIGTLSAIADVNAAEYQYEITAYTTEDGVLSFGLANAKAGGQWYVAQITSLTMAEIVLPAITEARSWDFTTGATYAAEITEDTEHWVLLSKGRYSNVPALENEALQGLNGPLAMTDGLTFTAASGNLMIGATANYFLQYTGGNVTMIVPRCSAGDTIVANYCSSGSGKTATVTSDNVKEGIETTATSNTAFRMVVVADGDVALVGNTNSRFYALAVCPFVAAAEGECKPATYAQAGIDVATKSWNYVITEGEEGETLSVKIGDAEAVTINSGDTIQVKPEVAVSITATIGENVGVAEFTAPAFVTTENVEKPAAKSTDLAGISYVIPALDNAGPGNGYAVKFRTNQTIDDNANAIVINVNEGFAITGVEIKGKNNFTDGDIIVESVNVDGEANLLDGSYILFNAAQDEQVATFSGVATKQIVISLGAVQGSANQFNADVTVTWAFADEAVEATDKFELQNAVSGIESLSVAGEQGNIFNINGVKAVKADGLSIVNGKVVFIKK